MSIQKIVSDDTKEWDRQPPADEERINELVNQANIVFPKEYLDFLRHSNGGEGEL